MRKRKRILAALASVLTLTQLWNPVARAEDAVPIDTTTTTPVIDEETRATITTDELYALEVSNEETATNNAYNMAVETNSLANWPQGPATYGEAGIIMDAKSGAILYAKNIDGKAYPASITKVLTALVALENGNLEDTVTITDNSISFLEYGDAHIGLCAGEEITLNDALHALLLASANEAAYAIGDNVGESYEWFIKQMNQRAKELGALNSNFVNTNGLHDENHYTTARDMAFISRELLLNHEEFKTISQTLQYTIPATNLQAECRTFQQKHKMFYAENTYYYENVVAGKTGYTDQAMNTLVTCADNGEMELVCVVLKTHGKNVYPDTRALFDYAYGNFHKVDAASQEKSEDVKEIADDGYVVLPEGVNFSDLEKTIQQDENDESRAVVSYTYQGNPVGSVNVVLSDAYLEQKKDKTEKTKVSKAPVTEEEKEAVPMWKWILLGVLGVIALLAVWMVIAYIVRYQRKKKRKQRRKRKK